MCFELHCMQVTSCGTTIRWWLRRWSRFALGVLRLGSATPILLLPELACELVEGCPA